MEIISRFTEYKKRVGIEPLSGTATYGYATKDAIGRIIAKQLGPLVRVPG